MSIINFLIFVLLIGPLIAEKSIDRVEIDTLVYKLPPIVLAS